MRMRKGEGNMEREERRGMDRENCCFLSRFGMRGCMRDCSRPWRAERGCCLGVHYSGLLISIHLLPSAHPTPPTSKSEREREEQEGARWDQKEIDGCPFSFFLSSFLSLPPHSLSPYLSLLLLALVYSPSLFYSYRINLHTTTDMHLNQLLRVI